MSETGWTHPELQEGEVFVGNFTRRKFEQSTWKSKRLGEVAYRKDGTVVPEQGNYLFPMFISRQEKEEAEARRG